MHVGDAAVYPLLASHYSVCVKVDPSPTDGNGVQKMIILALAAFCLLMFLLIGAKSRGSCSGWRELQGSDEGGAERPPGARFQQIRGATPFAGDTSPVRRRATPVRLTRAHSLQPRASTSRLWAKTVCPTVATKCSQLLLKQRARRSIRLRNEMLPSTPARKACACRKRGSCSRSDSAGVRFPFFAIETTSIVLLELVELHPCSGSSPCRR